MHNKLHHFTVHVAHKLVDVRQCRAAHRFAKRMDRTAQTIVINLGLETSEIQFKIDKSVNLCAARIRHHLMQ